MNTITTEDLGGGYSLRFIRPGSDYTDYTCVILVSPDHSKTVIVSGHENGCPEDMIWERGLQWLFRAGLEAGIAIGRSQSC